jgi:hypothetical protein
MRAPRPLLAPPAGLLLGTLAASTGGFVALGAQVAGGEPIVRLDSALPRG